MIDLLLAQTRHEWAQCAVFVAGVPMVIFIFALCGMAAGLR